MTKPPVHELLRGFSHVLNTHGPDAKEVEDYIHRYEDVDGFPPLARLARKLKRALTSPSAVCRGEPFDGDAPR